MSLRTVPFALTLLLAVGCGSKPATAGPPGAKPRDDMAKQMKGLSPEQRAAYMKQHPEAAQVLSGQSTPPDTP